MTLESSETFQCDSPKSMYLYQYTIDIVSS